ncbi:response regulator [bacterium]|nr:response regulator [bacterium]
MNKLEQFNVLVVEDSEDDTLIIKRCFKKVRGNKINFVRDGEEAIEYIFGEGKYEDRERYPAPGLILLDINLPKVDGFGVLKRIKAHRIYRLIPVIMLTTSNRDEDIIRSFDYGAVSYIAKPMDFEGFRTFQHLLELSFGDAKVLRRRDETYPAY